ncbi:MAG: dihydrofolate reductase [Bacteroidota bacterium]
MISLIFARSENNVIGVDNDLPWKLSGDLRRFKRLTTGHGIIIGRKTYESIGRPLPKRRNVVITRNPDWKAEGVEVVHSLEEALSLIGEAEELFIIGGSTLYNAALAANIVDKVYETLVHADVDGDTFLEIDLSESFDLDQVEACQADEKNEFAYTFRDWIKRPQ